MLLRGGGLRDGDGVLSAFQDPRVTGQGAGTGDGYLGGCGAGADGAFWGVTGRRTPTTPR